jgi:hypothetical protein
MAERSFEVADFQSIKLSGRHEVIVTTGAEESVRAEGDEESLEELDVSASSGTLAIGNRRRGLFGVRRHSRPVTVHVAVRELRRASIAGSGDIRVNRVSGQSFDGAIAGSGDISIGEMEVESANFAIAGSGDIKAAGRATRAGMRIAGSGDADLSGLIAEEVDISIKGSGDVRAHATGTARVSVKGSGDVDLAGGAKCTINQAGSGNVRCS